MATVQLTDCNQLQPDAVAMNCPRFSNKGSTINACNQHLAFPAAASFPFFPQSQTYFQLFQPDLLEKVLWIH